MASHGNGDGVRAMGNFFFSHESDKNIHVYMCLCNTILIVLRLCVCVVDISAKFRCVYNFEIVFTHFLRTSAALSCICLVFCVLFGACEMAGK